jgi:hypothetical protein
MPTPWTLQYQITDTNSSSKSWTLVLELVLYVIADWPLCFNIKTNDNKSDFLI